MADWWNKHFEGLHAKAEVLRMSEDLGIRANETVGALHRVWMWFALHSDGGEGAPGTTPENSKAFLDSWSDCPGISDAMIAQGWMSPGTQGGHLVVPMSPGTRFRKQAREREAAKKRRQRGENADCPRGHEGDLNAHARAQSRSRSRSGSGTEVPTPSLTGGSRGGPSGHKRDGLEVIALVDEVRVMPADRGRWDRIAEIDRLWPGFGEAVRALNVLRPDLRPEDLRAKRFQVRDRVLGVSGSPKLADSG